MKESIHITLSLKRNKGNFSSFSPLLQKGFQVKARVGNSIKDLLCDQFQVEEDYLRGRINTVFLEGQPVDDVETAMVKDGSTVALAAAMPGLVGATMRRDGYFAAFRSSITHRAEKTDGYVHKTGMVKIKLFNLVAGELGPMFLKAGVWVTKANLTDVLKDRLHSLQPSLRSAKKDEQEMAFEQLKALNWSEEPENVFLKVNGEAAQV
jgi:hypothetical protein